MNTSNEQLRIRIEEMKATEAHIREERQALEQILRTRLGLQLMAETKAGERILEG